jgi:hypothetical protein
MFSSSASLYLPGQDHFDDDDVVIIGTSSSSSLSSSSPSSSPHSPSSSDPSSSSSPPQAESDTSGLTAISKHAFPSFALLRAWINDHAKANGFEVRWRQTGGEGSASHGGSIHCWCFEKPPVPVKEEIISSTPALRTIHAKTAQRGGKQVKCGCAWFVRFLRRADQLYHVTSRHLTHTGHELVNPSSLTSHVDSMRNLPAEVQDAMERMIRNGKRGIESQRRYLQDLHKVTIDREVFRNVVKKIKRELGILDSGDDFKQLLYWLQGEMASTSAIARMRVDEDNCRVESVFYMSADMIHNFDRNGVVLTMDTTFKSRPTASTGHSSSSAA